MKKPKRIRNIRELRAAVKARQSVISPEWDKPRAASWFINMSAGHVMLVLKSGKLTVYTPKVPRRRTLAEIDLSYAVEVLEVITGEKPMPYGYSHVINAREALARDTLKIIRDHGNGGRP